jgi:hypothetical protein
MVAKAIDALSARDLEAAGGKGANLGELMRAGFPVLLDGKNLGRPRRRTWSARSPVLSGLGGGLIGWSLNCAQR